ncbi:hypothetical protein H5410_045065, partial [Solanum commersonii]
DEDSSRSTPNFLEMRTFKSSKLKNKVSKICQKVCCEGSLNAVSRDHRCTRRFAFGLLYRLSALAFSIFAFWIIRWYSTASQNCSATRRLLFFITDFIFSFRDQHTGTKGKIVGLSAIHLMD